jgi:hypothetical protein
MNAAIATARAEGIAVLRNLARKTFAATPKLARAGATRGRPWPLLPYPSAPSGGVSDGVAWMPRRLVVEVWSAQGD